MKTTALSIFHRPPECFNCAQAVLYAYKQVSGDAAARRPEDFRAMGGGRAPEGTCGALYAACQVCAGKAQALAKKFEARTGATTCKRLKAAGVRCETCVATAAELLENALKA